MRFVFTKLGEHVIRFVENDDFHKNDFFFQIRGKNIEQYLSVKFAYFPHKSQKGLNSIKLLCVNKS
ncbi:hypothetical protein DKC18_005620 [Acinetobacter nosocomialis]|nr:hypothetical protein DKC18_005620 [Acinetobacter nosocomialis]